jgi:hypothetical protein
MQGSLHFLSRRFSNHYAALPMGNDGLVEDRQ